MKTQYGDETVIFGDSLTDVACWIDNTPRAWHREHSHTNAPSRDWDRGIGFNAALELAKEGWSEGAQDLSHMLSALPPPTNKHADTRWDVAGDYPSVPRYLTGNPRSMLHVGKRQGSPPMIHLVINCVASCSVTAQEYVNYGTAMVAMIDQMEAQGRRVTLDLVFVEALPRTRAVLGWRVKNAGDHCDLAAIAYSLAHPAAFRRIGFALIERTNKANECGYYGFPEKLRASDAALIDAQDAFLLDGIVQNAGACRTVQGALRLAAEQINQAAGETLVEVEGV